MKSKIELWVDGSGPTKMGVGTRLGGWGVVCKRNGRATGISDLLGTTTCNHAELTAILNGISIFTKPKDLVFVHSDSQYCIGVLSLNWLARKNRDLIAAIKIASEGRHIRYQHIPRERNQRADKLSKRFLED